jgi:tRNA A-37 threonylcarbamoyl transferase component Bud32
MTRDPSTRPLSPAEHVAIAKALSEPATRLRRIESDGRVLWLKRSERLSWFWRLRKGGGAAALGADLHALRSLGAEGLPVPPVLDAGPDHFVTPDRGVPLHHLILSRGESEAARIAAFAAGGRALARLHGAGFRHGRPSIRDMLWDQKRVTLIDVERYREARNTPKGCAEDVLIAVHSTIAYGRGQGPELDAMVRAYRQGAPGPVWRLARQRARRLAPAAQLVGALAMLRPGSHELRAVPQSIGYLLNTPE